MRRLLGLILIFCIFSSYLALAGDVLKLDFTKQEQYLVGLKKGDRAEFYMNGERNIVIVDKITPDSTDVTVFVALNSGNHPHYITLKEKKSLKLDIERDNTDDMHISWYQNSDDLNYTYLLFQRLNMGGFPTGSGTADYIRERREYDKYIIGGFILSILLLVAIIIKRYKKSSNLAE